MVNKTTLQSSENIRTTCPTLLVENIINMIALNLNKYKEKSRSSCWIWSNGGGAISYKACTVRKMTSDQVRHIFRVPNGFSHSSALESNSSVQVVCRVAIAHAFLLLYLFPVSFFTYWVSKLPFFAVESFSFYIYSPSNFFFFPIYSSLRILPIWN